MNTTDNSDDIDDFGDESAVDVKPQNPLRTIVRGAYDIQKLRIMMGNRIIAQFKAKLGQQPSHTEEEDLDDESKSLLDDLRAEFKKLMDGVKKVKLATFKASPLISTFTEFSLLQNYLELEESEKRHFSNLAKILTEYPIYTQWLSNVSGIGPALAGVIISEIDITKATYPSSLWQYAGLGVESDGRGTSKRSEHLKDIAYTDKDGKPAVRKGILFNPFLKTKLMGVLSGSFLKSGMSVRKVQAIGKDGKPAFKKDGTPKMVTEKDPKGNSIPNREKCSPYALCYLDYRNRLQNHPNWKDKTKGHIHNASLRYMIKRFLVDLHMAWRAIAGLPVTTEYSVGKLGMTHHG